MESDRHAGQRRRSCPPAQAAQSKPGLQSSAEHGIREVVALRALSPERILSGCVAQEESLPLSCLCPKKDNSAHLKEDWPVNRLFMESGVQPHRILADKPQCADHPRLTGQCLRTHFDGLSAFRPCCRGLTEFLKSTVWALYGQIKGK